MPQEEDGSMAFRIASNQPLASQGADDHCISCTTPNVCADRIASQEQKTNQIYPKM